MCSPVALAYPGQLFAGKHVYNSPAAKQAMQNHGSGMLPRGFADNGRAVSRSGCLLMTSSILSAKFGGTNATSRPSLATYKGSSPRISQAPATGSDTLMAASSNSMPTWASGAI